MSVKNTIYVLSPVHRADEDGYTYASVVARLSLGEDVIGGGPGEIREDDIVDRDADRRVFFYDDADYRIDDVPQFDVGKLTAALGKRARKERCDRLRAAHRYLRAVRDDMTNDEFGGLGDAVVVGVTDMTPGIERATEAREALRALTVAAERVGIDHDDDPQGLHPALERARAALVD